LRLICTGEIEDYPGIECIPSYRVKISLAGEMKVFPTDLSVKSVERPFSKATSDSNRFVIIGSGE